MPRKIAILGAGVIGLFSAYYLRKQGFDVVVLDRGKLGQGCSSGNAGWICPSLSVPVPHPGLRSKSLQWLLRPDSPLYIRPQKIPALAPWLFDFWRACNPTAYESGTRALMGLAADAVDLYRQLANDGVDFELYQDGLLLTFQTEATMRREQDSLQTSGYGPVRVLRRDELFDLEPALASSPVPARSAHYTSCRKRMCARRASAALSPIVVRASGWFSTKALRSKDSTSPPAVGPASSAVFPARSKRMSS